MLYGSATDPIRLELLVLRNLWFEAKALNRRCADLAAEHVRSGAPGVPQSFDLGLPVARMILAMETRAARLVLQSASVANPGQPLPIDGFVPVSMDLGEGRECTVEPALTITEHPKGCGRRRVSFT